MRRTTCFAALALTAGLATGCGHSDPKPEFDQGSYPADPSTSPAAPAAPSSSAPAGPPEMPAEAKQHTKAGANAFTHYYFAAANYAQKTLDTARFRGLGDGGCDACRGAVRQLQSIAKQRGRILGGVTRLSHVSVMPTDAGGATFMRVTFHYHLTPMRTDFPGSKNDRSYNAVDGTSFVVLKPIAGGWTMDYWDA